MSVIVPVFNRQDLLPATLQSVVAQNYRPIEVIVVDDGSADKSGEIARGCPGVTLLRQANQGVAAARNAGVAASHGDLIAFLDSDDRWLPNKLSLQVAAHHANPGLAYSVTMMRNVLDSGYGCPPWLRPELLGTDLVAMLPSALVVRREAFQAIGGFDMRFRAGEDADWFLRASDSGMPMTILPELLLLRRIHAGNLTGQADVSSRNLLHALKATLVRKRTAALQTSGG